MSQPPNSPSGPDRNTPGKKALQPRHWVAVLGVLVLLVVNLASATLLLPSGPQRVDVPYTLFKQQVEAGNVVDIASRGDTIQGTFRQPVTVPSTTAGAPDRSATDFATVTPAFVDPGLDTLLEQQGVIINARSLDQPANPLLSLLLGFGPSVLLIGAFLWLSGRFANAAGGGGGMFSFGRSRAKRYDQAAPGVARITFADVAGIDESKDELVEVVDFLKEPTKYTRLGGAVPKGVLLVGPPGTGKTLLARAVAGEANVPFFSMGASEFVEMIVGVGASRVRDLFAQTRAAAPAIIFIDELDAIGRARGTGAFGGNDEREQTLNQILTEMDGFSGREGVIVIAATNRPDVLDQALLRPGRFDRRVVVQPPDKAGRAAILNVHTHGMPLASDVDLKLVASSTPGLVGADLKNLVNEAALLAARRNEDRVHQKDFLDALEKLVLGPARSVVLSPADRERVAYHEGGHTLCGLLVPGADPVNRVTIIPRGQALGVTYQRPDDDPHSYSEEYLQARIVGAMGGRAAEEVVYGGRTTGAENDIQQASALARQMVTRWGMSDELGPVTLAPRDDLPTGFGTPKPYSEATARSIDMEVRRILQEGHVEAARLLLEYRPQLDALAEALLEHETLEEQEILKVTGLPRAPRLHDRPISIQAAVLRRPA